MVSIIAALAIAAVVTDRARARMGSNRPAAAAVNTITGIVKSVSENSIEVEISGVVETFAVPDACVILKDRRAANLAAVFANDRVNLIVTESSQPVVVKLSAFGVE